MSAKSHWDAGPAYAVDGNQALFRLRGAFIVNGGELGQELLDAGIDTRNSAVPGGFEVIFYPPQTIGLPVRAVHGREKDAARIVNAHAPEIKFQDGASTKELAESELRSRIEGIMERESYPERVLDWNWEEK